MFLFALAEHQKRAFPTLATAVIHADRRIAGREASLMSQLSAELGSSRDELLSMDDALAAFDTKWARRAAFMELIGIAWCDGEMADTEAALLGGIANRWSIDGRTHEAMSEWVSRQSALLREADALIRA